MIIQKIIVVFVTTLIGFLGAHHNVSETTESSRTHHNISEITESSRTHNSSEINGSLETHHKVSKTKYRPRLYTTPTNMRGTWYYKNGKNYPNTGVSRDVLNPYSKLKITKHTITFYRKANKRALKGTYTLYKAPNKRFSTKESIAAENYAEKHKWLGPREMSKKGFAFSSYWLSTFQQTSTGYLGLGRSGESLKFSNAFYVDTFKR